MRILLVTPPLTQLNTPYPATPYLAGYLASQDIEVDQLDLGIELIGSLFTSESLAAMFSSVDIASIHTPADAKMMAMQKRYIATIDTVMDFLRGNNLSFATQIAKLHFLPQGERFKQMVDLDYTFGEIGIVDRAKYLATLYIEDISDFIRRNISEDFELIRYAESLCMALPKFNPLQENVEASPRNLVDEKIISIFKEKFEACKPDVVGFSIPFPGNLYGGLICGKWLKANHAEIKILMGGGYVNTELRSISDMGLFRYIDYLILDDGEIPILRLLNYFEGKCTADDLVRTIYPVDGTLAMPKNAEVNLPCKEHPVPYYSQLPIGKYFDMMETANPMMKLWSDGRWNKIMLAHGCYWAKCAFCDVSLDYIKRYDPYDVKQIVDMMEAIAAQTGQTGFHFVDEAAPPALLKKMSIELLRRGLCYTWWANIRFEKAYTKELALLMSKAGCIAVSGGLEVASDRLLKLMNKGVSIKQTAQVTETFSEAGILVHAYLMYGFPTETTQETIDSLEVVRQLFKQNLIQSAFWHRFAMTVHSPVGLAPADYKVQRTTEHPNVFANNEIFFKDHTDTNLEGLGEGLRKATYNYMHKIGLDTHLDQWFDIKTPKTTLAPTLIEGCLFTLKNEQIPSSGTYMWLADGFQLQLTDSKKPKLHIFNKNKQIEIILKPNEIAFCESLLAHLEKNDGCITVDDLKVLAEPLFANGIDAIPAMKLWKSLIKNGLTLL